MKTNNKMLLRKKREIENIDATTTPSLNDPSNSHLTDLTTNNLENDCDDQPLKKRLRSVKKEMTSGEETPKASSTSNTSTLKITPGDLVWSKLSGHPWWPSIIALDSDGNHLKPCGKYNKVFVSFFGNKCTSAWVSESMIVKYKGKEAFEKWAQSLLNAETKATKQTKLAKKYELKVASAHYEQWEKAIAKADKATGMNRNKRFDEFFSYFHTDSAETQKDDSTTESEHEEISETVLSNNQSNLENEVLSTSVEIPHEQVLTFTRNRIKALVLMQHNLMKLNRIAAEVDVPEAVIMKDFFGFEFEYNGNSLSAGTSPQKDMLNLESYIKMELVKVELVKALRRTESSNIKNWLGALKNSSLVLPVDYKYAEVRAICSLKLKVPMLFISYLCYNLSLNDHLENDRNDSGVECVDDLQVYAKLFELKNVLFKNRFDFESFSHILETMGDQFYAQY